MNDLFNHFNHFYKYIINVCPQNEEKLEITLIQVNKCVYTYTQYTKKKKRERVKRRKQKLNAISMILTKIIFSCQSSGMLNVYAIQVHSIAKMRQMEDEKRNKKIEKKNKTTLSLFAILSSLVRQQQHFIHLDSRFY